MCTIVFPETPLEKLILVDLITTLVDKFGLDLGGSRVLRFFTTKFQVNFTCYEDIILYVKKLESLENLLCG